jgi:excisionase family DNA binding protein
MPSAELKPAFRTLEFPEPGERVLQQDRRIDHHSSTGDTRLLTPQEVAERLGVSQRWVPDHVSRRSPRIPAVKLGPLLRFRPGDVEAFLTEHLLVSSKK